MSRLGRITRRSLLVAVAAVGGGVAFGYYRYRRDPGNPLTAGPGERVFNPWVVIDARGVTVITPRAEMGQGVQSTLAALVAEEMDLDWDAVRMEHGPASSAYYNEYAGSMAVPFAELATGRIAEGARGLYGAAAKVLGLQITGGSTSIIDAFTRMRQAGATARAMLVQAGADRLGVSAATLQTGNGAVVAPDGTMIPYTELAADAAQLEPPDDVPLKEAKNWKLLGTSLPRLDIPAKSTGTAGYGIDVTLPGMVFAAVRGNPRLGADMLAFDATEAHAMPGVKQIVDLGDGVAVVADNTWTAMRAAGTITIDSGPAPYPADSATITERVMAAFDDSPNATLRDDGDVDAALGGDAISAEYSVPFLAHATMEPMNATALRTGDKLTIWTGNQAPTLLRRQAARLSGLNSEDITIHTPFLGGGFGRRVEADCTLQAVKIAMVIPGTPVKLTWTREEDMRHDFYRPMAIARMRGAVDAGGPKALAAQVAAPSIISSFARRLIGFAPPGPDRFLIEGMFDQPYAIPNYRVAGYIADLEVPVGIWRSVGNSYGGFFHECFLDELAHAGGLDPVAMRLNLLRDSDEVSAKVLEKVADMAGWGGTLPDNHARGVAFTHSFGTPVAQIVEISRQDGDIRLEHVWAAIDVGIALDPRNIEAQIMSGIVFGLSAAIMGEISFADGMVEQANFPDYDALRMHQMPGITVEILTENAHMGGVGEPGTPPAAPALANAIFALTGQRIRSLPLYHAVSFV